MPQVIAIDIDNVLADTVEYMTDYIREMYDPEFTKDRVTTYDARFGGKTIGEIVNEFLHLEEWVGGNPILDIPWIGCLHSKVSLQWIDGLFVSHIITARFKRHRGETKDWLMPYRPPSDRAIFTDGEPKLAALQKLKATILIDDNPRELLDFANAGGRSIIFDQPWNRSMPEGPRLHRATNWAHVIWIVDQIERGVVVR